MPFSIFRLIVAVSFVAFSGVSLSAQLTGGTGSTGGTDGGTTTGSQTGGSTGSGSTIGAPSATGAGGSMEADVAFSAVDRGSTIGSTGETGTGFSAVSVATQGAGGGVGGLGGFRGLGGGGLGGLGGLSSLFGGLNNQGQAAKPAIRTRLRSAVEVERRAPAIVERNVGQRFLALPRPELRGVTVTMEGRRGILTGVVESERHRRMSEMLLRLEPGVQEIDNQLQVAGE